MLTYVYGLFDETGRNVDQTAIDERSPELAMELFKDFQKSEGYTITENFTIELMDSYEEEDEV
jgi:hypothetical protein